MIYDSLANKNRYKSDPEVTALLDALTEAAADGDFNKSVFSKATVAEYAALPLDQAPALENHHEFSDLYYMISGCEGVIISQSEKIVKREDYSAEKDVEWFEYSGHAVRLDLCPGDFVIIRPGEAHAAGFSVSGKSEDVKKVIIKIKAQD